MIKGIGVFVGVVLFLIAPFFTAISFAGVEDVDVTSRITFKVSELEIGRWQYDYTVENVSLMEGIGQFTIYFDYHDYTDLNIETTGPLSQTWDEMKWNPVANLGLDGGYDAQAEQFLIGPSMAAADFSVSFNWLGNGAPGSQFYEIINPDTQEVVDNGLTVPEPATIFLIGLGVVLFRKKQS